MKITVFSGLAALSLLFLSCGTSASESKSQTEQIIEQGSQRLADNQQAQKSVNKLADQSQALKKNYIEELKLLDSLNMYNSMLDRQLARQDEEISKLNKSINNATLIERQVLPLLERMVTAMESFIQLDMPFLAEERYQRVQGLKNLLTESAITTSEKARRVFEAYQIENEFGYTIESYKGNVKLDSNQFAVEFLRIGRIALLYRDLSGSHFGFWNKSENSWQPLAQSQYKRHITKGLKIAKEELSPELITIPLLNAQEAR